MSKKVIIKKTKAMAEACAKIHTTWAFTSISLTYEPVLDKYSFPLGTRQIQYYPGYHSILSRRFPTYPFIGPRGREDVHLARLCADWLNLGSNRGPRIHNTLKT